MARVERGAGNPRRAHCVRFRPAWRSILGAFPRANWCLAMVPCMSLGSPFTPCGPLRPAALSSGSNSSARRQYRIKRSVRAAAAPRNDDPTEQQVAVSAVLGALFGRWVRKQDPTSEGEPSPAAPKLGSVVGAVMAAFMLVRHPPGVARWRPAGVPLGEDPVGWQRI